MRTFLVLALTLLFTSESHAVYGGLTADTREFQFVRYLDITFGDRTSSCTGTLLERGMVLTAAHCVIDNQNRRAKKIVVRLKRGDTRGQDAWGASVHPEYLKDGRSLNDIAILFTFSESDGHATLPTDYAWARYKAQNRNAWFPTFLKRLSVDDLRDIFETSIPRDPQGHLWAYVVGFGLTCPAETCPTLTNSARYVGKPIYASGRDTSTCVRAPFDFKTAPQRFCAYTDDASITRASTIDGKSNANYGDSGGPMFAFDAKGNAVVIGIVNAGNRDHAFFTSVYDHVDFLRHSLNGTTDKVRTVTFGVDSKDTSEPKVESAEGLREVVPLIKSMLETCDHRVSGTRMGSAVHEIYADDVTYAGKSLRREQVRAQLDAFSKRWPLRTFRLAKVQGVIVLGRPMHGRGRGGLEPLPQRHRLGRGRGERVHLGHAPRGHQLAHRLGIVAGEDRRRRGPVIPAELSGFAPIASRRFSIAWASRNGLSRSWRAVRPNDGEALYGRAPAGRARPSRSTSYRALVGRRVAQERRQAKNLPSRIGLLSAVRYSIRMRR